MGTENVIICDRCDEVIRGVTLSKLRKPEVTVSVRSDLLRMRKAIRNDALPVDGDGQETSVYAEYTDMCDTCRDVVADAIDNIFSMGKDE